MVLSVLVLLVSSEGRSVDLLLRAVEVGMAESAWFPVVPRGFERAG